MTTLKPSMWTRVQFMNSPTIHSWRPSIVQVQGYPEDKSNTSGILIRIWKKNPIPPRSLASPMTFLYLPRFIFDTNFCNNNSIHHLFVLNKATDFLQLCVYPSMWLCIYQIHFMVVCIQHHIHKIHPVHTVKSVECSFVRSVATSCQFSKKIFCVLFYLVKPFIYLIQQQST